MGQTSLSSKLGRFPDLIQTICLLATSVMFVALFSASRVDGHTSHFALSLNAPIGWIAVLCVVLAVLASSGVVARRNYGLLVAACSLISLAVARYLVGTVPSGVGVDGHLFFMWASAIAMIGGLLAAVGRMSAAPSRSRIVVLVALGVALIIQALTGRSAEPDSGLLGWLASGAFLSPDNLSNVLRQSSINTILGVGMTMVIISGGIDLSVGAVLALAGVFSAAVLMTGFPPPFPYPASNPTEPAWSLAVAVPVAVVVAALVGALCGAHNAIPIVRLRVPPFIATLGMFSIARGLAFIYTDAGNVANLPDKFTDAVAQGPLLIIAALLVVAFGHIVLTRTRFGRAIYAIGGNEQAARLSGISVGGTKFWVYTICGLLAGIAGFLLAGRMQAGDPKSGASYELNAIAAVVLGGTSLMGGVGTVLGTLLGAIVMGCLQNGLDLMGVQWFVQMLVKGYVILLAVVLDQAKKRQ